VAALSHLPRLCLARVMTRFEPQPRLQEHDQADVIQPWNQEINAGPSLLAFADEEGGGPDHHAKGASREQASRMDGSFASRCTSWRESSSAINTRSPPVST